MSRERALWALAVGAFLVPVAHPLLLPLVGVASHLLWWAHVLPVALVTYSYGRKALLPALGASVLWLTAGERLFGAGYGVPADWATVGSLAVALLFTELLVGGFALYARSVSGRYQLLFMNTETGILRTSQKGEVLEVNPAGERILGRRRQDLLGRRIEELPGLSSLPGPAAIQAAGGWTGSLELPGEGGSRVRHLVAIAARQKEPPGHQLLLMDRTVEFSAETEKERQRKLATLGEALAGVAHELKNPLTVILAHGSMVRDGYPHEREGLLGVIEEMRRQGERMKELIEELLGYSRPAGEGSETDLVRLLNRLVRIEEMIRGRKIRLANRVRCDGPVGLPEARLEQIVTNLLSNAAEALGDEGGQIELRCWEEEDRVIVEVADSGPGIPPELLDEIFHPFVTTKGASGGTGLGLAISRRLARAMGGDLTARNRDSGGAAFRLALPVRPGAGAGEGPPPEPPLVQRSSGSAWTSFSVQS